MIDRTQRGSAWFSGVRLLAVAVVMIVGREARAQDGKPTFPIDAPLQDNKLYIIRTVDTQDALYVATGDKAINGTRLALKTAANDFAQWKFLATAGGERFLRAKGGSFFLNGTNGFRVPGNDNAIATNADRGPRSVA